MLKIFLLIVSVSVVCVCGSITADEFQQTVNIHTFTNQLYAIVSLFNGGLDGNTGALAYSSDWNGLFQPNLNQTWSQASDSSPYYPHIDPTVMSQSQGIIANAKAYFSLTDLTDREKFSNVIRKGTSALISNGWDSKYGGWFWQLSNNNKNKDAEKRKYYGSDYAKKKSSEGHSYAVIALANAFMVTHNATYLQTALNTLQVLNSYFSEGRLSGQGNSFNDSVIHDLNRELTDGDLAFRSGFDVIRKFEALNTLYDALKYAQRNLPQLTQFSSYITSIEDQIKSLGSFITTKVIQYPTSSSTAFLYHYYSPSWGRYSEESISTNNTVSYYANDVFPGLGLVVAYQLSQAVERGFDSSWISVAQKLITFFTTSTAFENGLVTHLYTDEQGQYVDPVQSLWWVYAEACRVFLHFAVLRDCSTDCLKLYDRTHHVVAQQVVDPQYNGWFEQVQPSTGLPVTTMKCHIYKTPEPEINFYTELLRLASANFQLSEDRPTQASPENDTPPSAAQRSLEATGITLAVILSCLFLIVGISTYLKKRSEAKGGQIQARSYSLSYSTSEPVVSSSHPAEDSYEFDKDPLFRKHDFN